MLWGNYGWGMGFGWIYMLLFWVVVVGSITYFARSAAKGSQCGAQHESPLDILKRRYARGEITKEEYGRMKDDLKRS